jgi:hypothetical protein
MKTYKVTAGETIYAVYETEIKAKDKKQAEKIANEISAYDYKIMIGLIQRGTLQ